MERKTRRNRAITVSLVDLANDKKSFEIEVPASSIEGLVPEYNSNILVRGTVQKAGRKVHVVYTIETVADLVCDRSLEDFEEPITVNVSLDFASDSELYNSQLGMLVEPDELRGLREDAQMIDLTDDVRQDLAVALPMKRVAPKYRKMELDELLQALLEEQAPEPDERWTVLKKLKTK